MTAKEPTPEELQKFWEWCGFKHNIPFPELAKRKDTPNPRRFTKEQWFIPRAYCGGEPPLTLDNLFKYAVPKLPYVTLENCKAGYRASASADMKSNPASYNDKPELALFRAIQEAIK